MYDKYGRITSLNRVGEFTTSYKYDTNGLLQSETSTNGTSKVFTYDDYDRLLTVKETVPDSKWLQKTYAYANGNVSSIQYSAQSGTIATENFVYANGYNTEIKLNGTTSIWKLTAENTLGQPTASTTGSINRTYSFDTFGIPTGNNTGAIQNFTYNFDTQKGNLLSRVDNMYGKTETFSYDNLNRLTNAAGNAITYTDNGNITHIQDVGSLYYANFANPYELTNLSPEGTAVPMRDQIVSYSTFQRPSRIEENGLSGSFTYNGSGDRVKMYVANGTTPVLTRYYIGDRYELDAPSNAERLYLGGNAYSAPAVFVKEAGSWKIYYISRDYLGSITHIANSNGTLKQELSYDAWGRLRNPSTQVPYASGSEPSLFLGRGYTGHEHLLWFGLVNMNARLYDPAVGRFLSPDPYVQMPDYTQNFNRYSYVFNNPLLYTDPDGEVAWFIPILIGAAIFGSGNLIVHAINGDINNFWDGLKYFGQGALVGATLVAAWSLAPLIPVVGKGIQAVMTGYALVNLGVTAISIVSAVGQGIFNGDWSALGNAYKILLGNFNLDENRSFFYGVWQGISRHTWEFLQTGLGQTIGQMRNSFGGVDNVEYFGGATLINRGNDSDYRWGFTLGPYINSKNIRIDDEIFRHEFGHTLQSKRWGVLYPIVIGVSSAISNHTSSDKTHGNRWYEKAANRYAERYYRKYYSNSLNKKPWDDLGYPRR